MEFNIFDMIIFDEVGTKVIKTECAYKVSVGSITTIAKRVEVKYDHVVSGRSFVDGII